jgi:glyceraldehyde 3-phosphate dehydrogenase
MKTTSLGLMGFGRIGRDLFRLLHDAEDLRIAAICDSADPEALEYLLKFDTLHGRFPVELSVEDGFLYIDGRQIPVLAEDPKSPAVPDWNALGVEVVVEATGAPRTRERVEQHLSRGAKRVFLCVPLEGPGPDATIVMGVNDHELKPEHKIVANSSCTAHCAGPLVKILHQAFGIERAFLSTVHAYSNKQRLADVPDSDKRRGRAAAENIIPQATEAAERVAELVPELAGKIHGLAMNVPVANGSLVDLVCWHRQPVTVKAINEVVRTAASASFRGIVDYEEETIVSSDILRSPYSATFDAQSTMVMGDRFSKTIAWFDNSWGYTHRLVELIRKAVALDRVAAAQAKEAA